MKNQINYRVYEYYIKENVNGEFEEKSAILNTCKAWTSDIEEAKEIFKGLQSDVREVIEASKNPYCKNSSSHNTTCKIKIFHTFEKWKSFSDFENEISCNLM